MKNMPATVDSYKEFDGDNPLYPIKLCGIILEDDSFDPSKHGILSVVVIYKTPFCGADGNPLLLCFALGVDMSVDGIIGIPFIYNLKLVLHNRKKQFVSHELQLTFTV